jgi:hypothetical protein
MIQSRDKGWEYSHVSLCNSSASAGSGLDSSLRLRMTDAAFGWRRDVPICHYENPDVSGDVAISVMICHETRGFPRRSRKSLERRNLVFPTHLP